MWHDDWRPELIAAAVISAALLLSCAMGKLSSPLLTAPTTKEALPEVRRNANGAEFSDPEIKLLDLNYQRRMAEASELNLIITCIQAAISAIGTAAVFAALIWTIRGTKSAVIQANAAVESNALARAAHLAERRPWITVGVTIAAPASFNAGELHLTVDFHLKNIGQSPATNVFPDPDIVVPDPEVNPFNPAVEMAAVIERVSQRSAVPFGSVVFPGQDVTLRYRLTVPVGLLRLKTERTSFIIPRLLGAVGYASSMNGTRHYTGFIFEVMRIDTANGAPRALIQDETQIPQSEIRLVVTPDYPHPVS